MVSARRALRRSERPAITNDPGSSRSLVIAGRSPHRPLALRASGTIEPS